MANGEKRQLRRHVVPSCKFWFLLLAYDSKALAPDTLCSMISVFRDTVMDLKKIRSKAVLIATVN